MKSLIQLGDKSICFCRDEKWRDRFKNHFLQFVLVQPCSPNQDGISKQAIVLSVAGDILSTISQCVYSLLLQPFSSGVHKYSHKAKKGGGIGTSQIPLNNIDCKANWLKFIDQWCDKDHTKTWSHQSHHASVPSLTLSIIIDPADEHSGFFRVILFYLARLYMCIIDLERPGWVIKSHSVMS